jgi:hypothetical protein
VWATEESGSGQVAHHFGVSWGEVSNSLHYDSRYCELQSPRWSEGPLKGQPHECIRVSANWNLEVE